MSASSITPGALLVGRAPPSLLARAGNLAAFVRVYSDADPARTALRFADDATLSYGDLDDEGGRLGEALTLHGVLAGQRVLVLVPVGPTLYPVLFGIMAIGAVAVIVDPSMSRAHLRAALRAAHVDVVVAVARGHLLRLLPELWRATAFVVGPVGAWQRPLCATRLDVEAARLPRGRRALARVDDDSDALITFTTGSTGVPRGARRSHGLLNRQGAVIDTAWPRRRDDVDLATLPVFATSNLAAGITTVFPRIDLRHVDLDDGTATAVRDDMLARGVTTFGGSPAFVDAVARAVLRDRLTVPLVRAVAIGGAPVLPALAARIAGAFPHSVCRVVYGATECEPIASIDLDAVIAEAATHDAGGGCLVGAVHHGVSVVLEDTVDGVGEVCVAGDHVLRDYLDEAVTAAATIHVDGVRYLRIGDVARRDERGRLWLLGRRSDAVVGVDGRVRYPLAVEAIARARGVVGAFVGVGGRAIFCVVDGDVADVADLADEVVRVETLPLDPRHRARIDRRALRALLEHR